MIKPDVKKYLDCYLFLQDIYKYQKKENTNFSYQNWCMHLGLKSKSYLRFVVLGKRKISLELLNKLIRWLDFADLIDEQYFLLLVQYTQQTDEKLKLLLSKKLMNILRTENEANSVVIVDPTISDPLSFQIRDLVSYDDVLHTDESISKVFNKTQSEIEKYLEMLVSKNLIYRNQLGYWRSTQKSIKINDDQGNSILHDFHTKSLLDSIQLIKTDDHQKKFRTLHLALTNEEFADINAKIYNLLTDIFNEYSQKTESQGKKIYQINYNISSRSKVIEPVVDESSCSK